MWATPMLSHSAGGGGSNGLLTGLVNYYALGETSGTRADSHGANDLSTVFSDAGGGTGKDGGGYRVDSDDDYIRADSYSPVSGSNSRSVFLWVNPTTYSTGNVMVSWGAGTGQRFTLRVSSGNLRLEIDGAGYTSALAVSTGGWRHVGVTFSGTTLAGATLWVNGSSEACTGSDSINTTVSVAADGLTIGGRGGLINVGIDSAVIDEVGIWSRALSSGDVAALYNSGTGLFYASFD